MNNGESEINEHNSFRYKGNELETDPKLGKDVRCCMHASRSEIIVIIVSQ